MNSTSFCPDSLWNSSMLLSERPQLTHCMQFAVLNALPPLLLFLLLPLKIWRLRRMSVIAPLWGNLGSVILLKLAALVALGVVVVWRLLRLWRGVDETSVAALASTALEIASYVRHGKRVALIKIKCEKCIQYIFRCRIYYFSMNYGKLILSLGEFSIGKNAFLFLIYLRTDTGRRFIGCRASPKYTSGGNTTALLLVLGSRSSPLILELRQSGTGRNAS